MIGTAFLALFEGAGATDITSLLGTFGPLVIILVLFYFLLIRPQRKKQKQVDTMLKNIQVGDRVRTIGGLYGRITSIKDDDVTIASGKDQVELVFSRSSVGTVENVDAENEL